MVQVTWLIDTFTTGAHTDSATVIEDVPVRFVPLTVSVPRPATEPEVGDTDVIVGAGPNV